MPPRRSTTRKSLTQTGANTQPLDQRPSNDVPSQQATDEVQASTQGPSVSETSIQALSESTNNLQADSPLEGSPLPSVPPKRVSKFKPKATVRQSEQHREQLRANEELRIAKANAEKAAAEQKLAASHKSSDQRLVKPKPHGQGGRNLHGKERDQASGPFSSGRVQEKTGKRTLEVAEAIIQGGIDGSMILDPAIKTEDGKAAKRRKSETRGESRSSGNKKRLSGGTKVKEEPENTVFISSDEEDDRVHGERVNIESINLLSDNDDEDPSTNESSITRPIFVDREVHVDRPVDFDARTSLADAEERKRRAQQQVDEVHHELMGSSEDDDHVVGPAISGYAPDLEAQELEQEWYGMYDESCESDGEKVQPSEYIHPSIQTPVILEIEGESEPKPAIAKTEKRRTVTESDESEDRLNIKGKGQRRYRRRGVLDLQNPKHWRAIREDEEEWDQTQRTDALTVENLINPHISRQTGLPQSTTTPQQSEPYILQFPTLLPQLIDDAASDDHDMEPSPPAAKPAFAIDVPDEPQIQLPIFKPVSLRKKKEKVPSGKVGKLVVHESGAIYLHWGHGPDAAIYELKRGNILTISTHLMMLEEGLADKEDAKEELDVLARAALAEDKARSQIPQSVQPAKPAESTSAGGPMEPLPKRPKREVKTEGSGSRETNYGDGDIVMTGDLVTLPRQDNGRDRGTDLEDILLNDQPQSVRKDGSCSLGAVVGSFTCVPNWECLLGSL